KEPFGYVDWKCASRGMKDVGGIPARHPGQHLLVVTAVRFVLKLDSYVGILLLKLLDQRHPPVGCTRLSYLPRGKVQDDRFLSNGATHQDGQQQGRKHSSSSSSQSRASCPTCHRS